MSATSTTYDVRVKYLVDDTRAKRGMREVGREADRAGRSVDGLGSKLKGLMAGAVAYLGFRTAYKALVGYNAELENTQAQLRTVFQLNEKGTFLESNAKAVILMKQFRQDARQTAGTFQDMSNFASDIANSVLSAGGGSAELRQITKGSIVASKAMFPNMEEGMAARDVMQAMQGTLTNRDIFAKGLLSSQGISNEQFNAMDAGTRMRTWMKALQDPAILDAAKAYETSWVGAVSALKEGLQETLGKIGLPLFKALGDEVRNMNKWIANNSVAIGNFASSFAAGIMDGFRMIKGIMSFIAEHKDLLMALAKAALIGKVVGGVVRTVAGAGGMFDILKNGVGLSALAKNANLAAVALSAVAVGASLVADAALNNQEKRIQQDIDTQSLMAAWRGAQAGQTASFYKTIEELGAIDKKTGKVDYGKLRQSGAAGANLASWAEHEGTNNFQKLIDAGRSKIDAARQARVMANPEAVAMMSKMNPFHKDPVVFGPKFTQSIDDVIASLHALRAPVDDLSQSLPKIGAWFLGGAFADDFNKLGKAFKPQVNIGKIVMNVESNDPDNFAIGMEGYFRAWTSNPTSNPKSIREGR